MSQVRRPEATVRPAMARLLGPILRLEKLVMREGEKVPEFLEGA